MTIGLSSELEVSEFHKLSHYLIVLNGIKVLFAFSNSIPVYDPDNGLKTKDIILLNPENILMTKYNPSEIREAICNHILEEGYCLQETNRWTYPRQSK